MAIRKLIDWWKASGNNIYNRNSGNVGIGNSNPASLLTVGLSGTTLGVIRLEGSTSGFVSLQAAAVAGSSTFTLPSATGSNAQVLQTNASAVLSWATVGTPNSVAISLSGGNIVTTSTTFVYLSSAETAAVSLSLTTAASKVLVLISGTCGQSTSGSTNYIDLEIDGTRIGGTSGLQRWSCPGTGYATGLSFTYLTPSALTAGNHIFKPQWKIDTQTGTIDAAAVAPLHFAVIEQT